MQMLCADRALLNSHHLVVPWGAPGSAAPEKPVRQGTGRAARGPCPLTRQRSGTPGPCRSHNALLLPFLRRLQVELQQSQGRRETN